MPHDQTLVLNGTNLDDVASDLSAAGWATGRSGTAIEKKFYFEDFRAAMTFMLRTAFEADAADHHPEWFNVYNRVEVALSSHDANGVTARDLALARAMEKVISGSQKTA